MPSPEQPTPASPEVETQAEQRHRTVAVRVNDELHSQLGFIAQLSGRSISEEIRQAIESRIADAGSDPDLIARAEQLQQKIERDAAARTAAIAGFMGKPAVAATTADQPGGQPSPRRGSKADPRN